MNRKLYSKKIFKLIFCLITFLFAYPTIAALKSHPHHIESQKQRQFLNNLQSIEFAPKLILASDYVWRGVTQSNNGPAVQGNFLLHNKLGMYSGIFGTNTNYPGTDGRTVTTELQLYAGLKNRIACFDYDFGIRRYIYPNAIGPDFTEGFFVIGYKIFSAGIARSNEVPTLFGDGGTYHGTYYSAQMLYQLPIRMDKYIPLDPPKFSAHIGHYAFSNPSLRDNSYTDFRLALEETYKLVTFILAWTDTNNADAFIGQNAKSILTFAMGVCW